MMTSKILNRLLNIEVKNAFVFAYLTTLVYMVFMVCYYPLMSNGMKFMLGLAMIGFYALTFLICKLFFAEPNYYYANLLIERIKRLCHQYRTDKNDKDIDDIIKNIIYEIDYKLKNNSDTIGFWLCNKNRYKGKFVKSYLDFVESRLIRKAIEMLDKKERHLQEYRQKQEKQEFVENKIDNEICQNIDLRFGGVR